MVIIMERQILLLKKCYFHITIAALDKNNIIAYNIVSGSQST